MEKNLDSNENLKKKYYTMSTQEVLDSVNSKTNGISSSEAQQRLEKYGKNKLQEAKKDNIFVKILKQLSDPMIIMLLVAAGIQLITTIIQKEYDFIDFIVILIVVLINTCVALIQEGKAENAINALMEMTAPETKVMRDGMIVKVKSENLVVGDVIVLEAGDAVPADARIIEAHSMKVEEAALTGESVPVNKFYDILTLKENQIDIGLGDRKNMLYSGSTVVYGRGTAVIVATGMDTEMGKIADALTSVIEEETPLQRKMADLSRVLTWIVLGISVFMVIFNILRAWLSPDLVLKFAESHNDPEGCIYILDVFILAISLAVAAIPEGLPAVVTIILTIGVNGMSKRNARIRKMSAVETLGCTQIICSDKTGTLTQNKMTVTDFYSPDEKLLAKGMALCSDSIIREGETESTGEPTECALVNYANKLGMPKYLLEKDAKRIGEAPFDSNRKMMSTIHNENGKFIQYTKGACEILLDRCNFILGENGEIKAIDDQIKQEIMKVAKTFADRALRVLACGYKVYDDEPNDFEADHIENNLIFIGFVGMIDPCRPEVKDAIRECREAHIRPVMITGDHIDTAVAIGKDLGIITDASQAILGSELDSMDDEKLKEVVQNISVFARVQPEHKTRIVTAFKSLGFITAMTGDGVNDAPSIKTADIGVGMGITGTDVTKGVADMVLADDNFATIVNAVGEGRKIFDNIKKVIQFQLSTNMSEVLVVFIQSLLGLNILSATHLLWVNMITDSAPGLALGAEEAEPDIMKRPVRNPKESVFANGAIVDTLTQGIFMAFVIFMSYFIGSKMDPTPGRLSDIGATMAFITCNLAEMFHAVTMRSQRKSIFSLNTFNTWLLWAVILITILTFGVVLIPGINEAFEFVYMEPIQYVISGLLGASVVIFVEIEKFVHSAIRKMIKK